MAGIVRSITHWTAGGGRASEVDKEHYHRITEHDGNVVHGDEEIKDNIVTADGDYAAHTLNLNTGSAGMAMAGMRGARDVDAPDWAGPSPINARQFEHHCRMLAEFHVGHGIPVTRTTCLTHAEVEPNLGVKQRGKWDLTRLPFKPELRGALAVGDYMRERVRAYMPHQLPQATNRPYLREGDRGLFVQEAQSLLRSARIFLGDVDGNFGPITKRAVVAFQSAKGLDPDGVIGPDTWDALMSAPKAPERDVTEDDLRKRGSETIAAADSAETTIKSGAVATVGLGTLDTLMEAGEKIENAQGTLDAVQTVMLSNWPILIVVAGGAVAYFYGGQIMQKVRSIRTKDARIGANLKR